MLHAFISYETTAFIFVNNNLLHFWIKFKRNSFITRKII